MRASSASSSSARAVESGRTLAQQHHLMLGARACFFAIVQPALRRGQLAFDFDLRQLLIVERRLELVELAVTPSRRTDFFLPLVSASFSRRRNAVTWHADSRRSRSRISSRRRW